MDRYAYVEDRVWPTGQCDGVGQVSTITAEDEDSGDGGKKHARRKIGIERDQESLDHLRAEAVVASVIDQATARFIDGPMKAKKDFEICHNTYHKKIKAGDDLTEIPAMYHANLRTEGVL